MQVTASSKAPTCFFACRSTLGSAWWGLVTNDAVVDSDCQHRSLGRPGISEGVAGVVGGQLPRRALLGGLIVHAIVLDLIPLLQGMRQHPAVKRLAAHTAGELRHPNRN